MTVSLIFEPHNGFGGNDPDGEPWPFGYISILPGQPVFEISPVLEASADSLTTIALQMAAAPALVEALAMSVAEMEAARAHLPPRRAARLGSQCDFSRRVLATARGEQ